MKLIAIALAVAAMCLGADWQLVWSDEFDKPGLPDSSKWTYEEGFVRNHELQLYTKERSENARVEDGKLIIEARREKLPNPRYSAGSKNWQTSREFSEYTSAGIRTRGKADWRYGKFEVRAKLPTGRGTWPAIWMLGANCDKVGWPRCGEIDIMENVGFDPDVIHANIHTEAYNHVRKTNKGNKISVAKPYADFHVYALEWTPDKMDFFIDGKKYFTFENEKTGQAVWPYDQPFYLILNVAVGGDWGGQKGLDAAIFPQRMEVDYVRVYQQGTPAASARQGKWIQLFNGKNLDGWTPKITGYELGQNFANTFRLENGVMKVSYDGYDAFNNRFGHIFYKNKYSRYIIAAEYRFVGEQAKGGPGWATRNSGIMIHCQPPETMGKDQDFPISIEVQLLGGLGKGPRTTANLCTPGTNVVMNGALVTTHCINSKSKTFDGDQWVRVEVEVNGSEKVRHIVNGETVLEYEKPQIGGGNVSNFDSNVKKDGMLLNDGYISLQSESHPIEFRKVELLDLTVR